jgi:3-methyladenine DNA glycosylase Tag
MNDTLSSPKFRTQLGKIALSGTAVTKILRWKSTRTEDILKELLISNNLKVLVRKEEMADEHRIPPREVPENDAGYFEKITQAVFQSGFSWQVIRIKWPNFQTAFARFDIDRVAAFTEENVERLLENKGIVRNGRKIQATVHNARICQELIQEHGSFPNYLRTMDDLDYYQRARRFSKKFKFMGPMGAYFFYWSVGEEVPPYEEWRSAQDK